LDVEAEVDEDEEDFEEDEEELLREDGFIQEAEVNEVEDHDDRLHREVDRRREAIAEADAERLASEYREKYGRSTASKYRGDTGVVPQRLLLPSVHDPNIWGVRCKPGKEKELVRSVLKKKMNLQYTKTPLEIFSAFQRDTFTGYIYIEARKQTAVQQALRGFANVYAQSMVLVPIKEYPDMFRVNKSKDQELTPGTYVRIKRGKYAGDLAIVENLSENGLEARLKVVPRLDYGKSAVLDTDALNKRKRPGHAVVRPPPRLFSAGEATQYDQRNLQRRGPHSFIYSGEEYENGYLLKDFKITYLATEDVNPNLDELTRFNNANEDGIDLQALSQSLKQSMAAVTFQPGEFVEVYSGEQAGMHGKVVDVNGDIVTVVGTGEHLKDQRIELPVSALRKRFSVGDHVRVVKGNYKDDTGMVVKISKDNVTLLSDLSRSEITVFSKDLKPASDIGGSNVIGKYELHDLVQLNSQTVACIVNIERDSVSVLDQDSHVRTVSPSSITMKVTKGSSRFATDRNGREIREGDTVKEFSGEGRQGVVLHIHRSFVFLHDRNVTENLGVFVNRISNVAMVSSKGARDEKELSLSKMNPNVSRVMGPPQRVVRGGVPRHKLVGRRVTIGRGSQYKGLSGTLRDFNDSIARIELDAKSKIVTVDMTRLLFHQEGGNRKLSYDEVVSNRPGMGGRPGGPPDNLPSNGPGGPGTMGSATPAWAAGSGRTPAWQGGARTPAWAGGAGGRTPAWVGDKTPAYGGGGSRTPAWNAGSRTPAWSSGGGRTPAHGEGGRTPAWNAGATTPGWDIADSSGSYRSNDARNGGSAYPSAPTPGFAAPTPGPLSAPTPAPYRDDPMSAPTPGAPTPGVFDAKTPGVAATPGAWAMDDSETPRYEASTP
jgi:transcription elongation factor SPT5